MLFFEPTNFVGAMTLFFAFVGAVKPAALGFALAFVMADESDEPRFSGDLLDFDCCCFFVSTVTALVVTDVCTTLMLEESVLRIFGGFLLPRMRAIFRVGDVRK